MLYIVYSNHDVIYDDIYEVATATESLLSNVRVLLLVKCKIKSVGWVSLMTITLVSLCLSPYFSVAKATLEIVLSVSNVSNTLSSINFNHHMTLIINRL